MKIIMHDGSIEEHSFDEEIGRGALRHTASHVLAQAVKRLFPETKLAIGPSIKDGFYYDFDRDGGFSNEDIAALEAEMKKIVKENLKMERFTLPRAEAIKLMEDKGEPYKVELINDLPEDEELSFFKQGDYVDLCEGPHVTYTSAVKAFLKRTRCSLVSMARRFQTRPIWRNILPALKKPKSATIAESARRWVCSCSLRKVPDSRSSCPTA